MTGGLSGRGAGVRFGFLALSALLISGLAGVASAETYLVKDQAAYTAALAGLKPGDELVLKNGTWQNFEMLFTGTGTAAEPITLRAQTPGQVVISGTSNLRLAGEHLVVSGLVFRDGASPSRNVIAFRREPGALANHSRLTQTVVENFSKHDRTREDQWIVLYGKNNRVDHNFFAGKTNKGPTLVVRLDEAESRENNHVIEQNFFGRRDSIGGNGGETLRIGVSDYSRTRSNTRVVRNFFEHCDGEVEIISIKAEGNLVARNVFYESRGAVVFRHGGSNEISRNVFFGNGVSDTGGVRVINDRQTVKENYFEGLRGEKFLSALTIMNGVPDSPINRYHQVTDAEVSNNSFLGFDAIGLAVGSDEERSAAPKDSVVRNNLFITDAKHPVSVFDDISGIAFKQNASNNPAMAAYGSTVTSTIELVRADNGLLYPVDKSMAALGAPRDLDPIKRADTGPDWFTKPAQSSRQGRETRVAKGSKALVRAVANSQPGDVLKLRGKHYALAAPIVIPHALTIDGRSRNGKQTEVSSTGDALFTIPAGGALTLSDVDVVATPANKAVIRATGSYYQGSYALKLRDVGARAEASVKNLPFLAADATTFATLIDFDEIAATDWPGTFISLSGKSLEGWYLAEDIKVRNSTFTNTTGPLISFGREGRDESTFGPRFVLQDTTLTGVNADGLAIDLRGIDGVLIERNTFKGSGGSRIKKRVLGNGFDIDADQFESTPEVLGVNDEPLALAGADDS